jgi:endoglucanase
LFFALVANDRAQFERLLSWTQNNLANGDLRAQQPAWLWGSDVDLR